MPALPRALSTLARTVLVPLACYVVMIPSPAGREGEGGHGGGFDRIRHFEEGDGRGAQALAEGPSGYRAKDPRDARRDACVDVYLEAFRKGDENAPRITQASRPTEAKRKKGKRDATGPKAPKGTKRDRVRVVSPAMRPDDPASAVLAVINRQRAKMSMPALRRSATLELSARVQAADMAMRSYRDHVSPEGCTLFDRAIAWLGYPSGGVAENLADGSEDPTAIVSSWLASPRHRANILHPEYVETGVASVRDRMGRTWWAQVFGDDPGPPTAFVNAFECPAGYGFLLPPGVVGVGACASVGAVRGPFPEAMRASCRGAREEAPGVCASGSWPRTTFLAHRGKGWCLQGAKRDARTSVCLEGRNTVGPLPQALRAACHLSASARGGDRGACDAEIWGESLLRASWDFGRFGEWR